ncbi:flavin reductase family protein [Nocardioides nitrophenolicus]|uniref:flavin reductase family protein n=1 Tax=Nocardioides nitrophenolicus TaxID=60489 RepID=UPI0019585047|nr:flavin reductase family protein [Nocardioides nitrophenolicus]MBM7517503.1 3-hydroxy-9,10-secoandrosta-1,3,5(10)-triene-9,17-dione monooxygenase reductase component [Nocardioides nitrophenolicus]
MTALATDAGRDAAQVPVGDTDTFRRACAQFPTGVAVITTSVDGECFGSTVNAFTSLTLEPPQVLVCLADSSRTWAAIERSRTFVVNLLADDQGDLARLFATKDPDKFSRVAHRPSQSGPLLTGTVGRFACDLADAIRNHSHWILVGRVSTLSVDPDVEPLLFFRGRMRG